MSPKKAKTSLLILATVIILAGVVLFLSCRRFGEIKEFIAWVLPELHETEDTKTWSMEAVPSIGGGALLISGEVKSKNDFAVIHQVINTYWAIHSDRPIEIRWEINEINVGMIPADQVSEDWLK
jgi:hypothetical protein